MTDREWRLERPRRGARDLWAGHAETVPARGAASVIFLVAAPEPRPPSVPLRRRTEPPQVRSEKGSEVLECGHEHHRTCTLVRMLLLAVLLGAVATAAPSENAASNSQPGAPPRAGERRRPPTTGEVKRWRLRADAYGPVRIGMTLTQASKALGRNLDPGPRSDGERACFYGRTLEEPVLEHVGFMFLKGRLARVDVFPKSLPGARFDVPDIRTQEGAGIGTTEEELAKLYPSARTEPHHYTDGHYVVVRRGRSGFVFETEGKRVTTFRCGKPSATSLVEGCS